MLIGLIIRPIDLNRLIRNAVMSTTSSSEDDIPAYEFGSDVLVDEGILDDLNEALHQYLNDFRYDITIEHYCEDVQAILSLVLNTAITESNLIFNARFPGTIPDIVDLNIINTRGDVYVKWSVRTMLTLQPQV